MSEKYFIYNLIYMYYSSHTDKSSDDKANLYKKEDLEVEEKTYIYKWK